MTTTLEITLEDDLFQDATAVAHGMGLELSECIVMFLAQMVREKGLPFCPDGDPFYSPSNIAALHQSIAQAQAGRLVHKTMADLEAMEASL